ncbi:MAG TPA: ribosome biogenesis GTPase Der [Methylomirabilota bacterium]|nr:ribosome biogenesis GTPase Der [Methylomirabilota bacterium]
MAGVIAIVGRPNVGKSALFNRIVGRRIAIVHDQPGVTRDRVSAEAEWRGKPFTLIDTGGIGLLRGEKSTDVITAAAVQQVELAIEAAQVIIFVVNVQEGIVPLDSEVADRLRRAGKPVLVAVNKADHERVAEEAPVFERLGFDKLFPVSAIHGLGMSNLMDAAYALLPTDSGGGPMTEEESVEPLKIAIVGRPNVGKSSIINALTRSERVIVSPIPGTTRDAVDVPFEVETEGVRERYLLIDTAGVRQERRIDDSIEFYSVKRTEESIERADIVVFMIDAEAGVTSQDKKVAGKIQEARKACLLVVNKWDLVLPALEKARQQQDAEEASNRDKKKKNYQQERTPTTLNEFAEWVQSQLFFIDYAPVIFASAKTGFHLDRFLEAIRYVAAQLKQQVPTSLINRTLHDAIEKQQPVSAMGHRLKFFYATQVRQAPPTFLLFVNRDELFSDPYTKYLEREVRRAFGFEGCPILLVPKPRPKTIDPIRKERKVLPTRQTRSGRPRKPTDKKKRLSKKHARPR